MTKYKYTTQPAHVLMKEWQDKEGHRCTSFIGCIWDEEQAKEIALAMTNRANHTSVEEP